MTENRRKKMIALVAGATVLGVGGVLTLAAWLDTEWVFGGTDGGGPGIGTSTFDVVQDASSPFNVNAPSWASYSDNPGDNLSFGVGALALAPGETVYAPVALTTTSASVSGDLTLQAAVPATGVTTADTGNLLWNTLEVSAGYVVLSDSTQPPACTAAGFSSYTPISHSGTGLGAIPTAVPVPLDAAGGNIAHFCFAISMPSSMAPGATFELADLQGRTAAPAWEFIAESD